MTNAMIVTGARVVARVRASGALGVGALLLSAGLAQAAPVPGQGTWETSLQGRDIDGNPVPLLLQVTPTPMLNPAAVFLYDRVQNLTWYNYSAGANPGLMTWGAAVAWAANLDVGGFDDWELPKIVDTGTPGCEFISYSGGTDCGYNVDTSGSELAHLWYLTLGNLANCTPGSESCSEQTGWGLTNTGPFQNLQSYFYWSGTEYAPGAVSAWYFNTHFGGQSLDSKNNRWYALAVRPGDVVAASVPEPQPLALALLGLAALWVAGRRRPHRGLGASKA